MSEHPSGNSELIQQHNTIQNQGDQELQGAGAPEDESEQHRIAGVVKPDDGSMPHFPRMKGEVDDTVDSDGSVGGSDAGP